MAKAKNSSAYKNVATSDTKALIIYLLDISRSMNKPLEKNNNQTRLNVVMDSLVNAITVMVQRSLKQGAIRPRYRLAIIAYSDELWDVLGEIKSVDEVADIPLHQMTAQTKTNPALGFKYVKKLLETDLATWTDEQKKYCPAPLVVHMTDGEVSEIHEDPEPIARQIQDIVVPDGNVLVENIYLTDDIDVETQNINSWPGYFPNQNVGNPYGNKLLAMSSVMPEAYSRLINEKQNLQLKPGAVMMFPGITPQFVQEAFVMNGVTGILGDKPVIDESLWTED